MPSCTYHFVATKDLSIGPAAYIFRWRGNIFLPQWAVAGPCCEPWMACFVLFVRKWHRVGVLSFVHTRGGVRREGGLFTLQPEAGPGDGWVM